MKSKLTLFIFGGLVGGIIVGLVLHLSLSKEAVTVTVDVFSAIAHLFLNLIKMVVAPLIFAIIVSGITGMARSQGLGRLFAKALSWFVAASIIVGAYGMLMAHALGVGRGVTLPAANSSDVDSLAKQPMDILSFIENLAPASVIQAMADNNALQILVFGSIFGLAVLAIKNAGDHRVSDIVDELVPIMLKLTNFVMLAAPVGIFSAVASAFTEHGLDSFATYGSLIASFYGSLAGLWVLMLLVGSLLIGRQVFRLLRAVREPMIIAFSTASSEAALAKLIDALTHYGLPRRTTGFVLPMGYSFNLDGSMMYMTFASVFLINAYDLDIGIGSQIAMFVLLLLSHKGMAGVPRGAFVVLAAVLPSFGIPAAGLAALLVIDQLLDMGRTATNIFGNALATVFVSGKHREEVTTAPAATSTTDLTSSREA